MQVVQRAVNVVEGGNVRPVEPKEAAQGRIDYVKVRNWGSGQSADLGSLEVESFTPGEKGGPGATGGAAPRASEAKPAREPLFHEQLARRLAQLQEAGELQVAGRAGAARLPPFQRWSFREERYIQWLADMQAAHLTLEAAIADATTVASTEHYGDSGSGRGVFAALERFGEAAGLDRSLDIAADLNNIARSSTLEGPIHLVPGEDAQAYCAYLGGLSTQCMEAGTLEERCDGAQRLLANAYSLHIAHLTTGMRIGAAAAEKLDLFPVRALNYFRTWPPAVGKDPLALLLRNVNAAGAALDAPQREGVMAELKAAFPKVSLLLSALAHEH
ncbi:hypothetical protein WJX81_004535 [Elliptochloris bilobata]|uniref:Uncharacterized protein n=1 Tax=Elliptochloris bilobata TaxID=381761 RepID=A0AAW1QZR5_9CHLO